MDQGITQATDDLYMYKFRTNLCSEKRRCTNPSGCFDAHSNIMKRRVPTQMKSNGGLFNYIPEACPEWRKSKKCFMGKSCPRSHGWLEIIFHPLLYKTKLCKAPRRNGVCGAYGVYCAKAHTRCEIRSLVEIYGENWKRHYDIANRLKVTSNRRPIKATTGMARSHKRRNSVMMKKQKRNIDRVGLAVPPRNRYILDVNLFAKYLLGSQESQLKLPPICLKPSLEGQVSTDSDVSFEDLSSCDERVKNSKTGLCLSKRKITSYTQLYSSDHTYAKEVEDGSQKHEVSASPWQKDESSQSTSSPAEDPHMTSCCSFSLWEDELVSKLSLDGVDWGNCLYCEGDNWANHSCILLGRDNEILCEQVSKNELSTKVLENCLS